MLTYAEFVKELAKHKNGEPDWFELNEVNTRGLLGEAILAIMEGDTEAAEFGIREVMKAKLGRKKRHIVTIAG